MTGQSITIRGTRTDCWFVNRFSSDGTERFRQSCEEEWLAFVAQHCVVAYSEFFGSEVCPTVQFILRRTPIIC